MKFKEWKAMQEAKKQAEYHKAMGEIGIEIITEKEVKKMAENIGEAEEEIEYVESPANEKEFDLFDTPLSREMERRAPDFDWLGI